MQTDVSQLSTVGNDTVEILTGDHEIIKSLLATIVQPMQPQLRKETLERLKAVLTVHNATEENLVYPALNKIAGKKSESEKLYHETAQADVLMFELDTLLKQGDDSAFVAKAKKLQQAVLEHIEDEEDSAFPHLQKGSEPKQAQMLTASVREFRNAFRFNASAAPRTKTGEIPPKP